MNLLIVFNHHYPIIVKKVVSTYKEYFSEIVVASPFKIEGGLQYSSGSYMWQGAIVEYLKEYKNNPVPTLVIHDDVALNINKIKELVSSSRSSMGTTYKVSGDIFDHCWNFKLCTNYFQSKSVLFGSGSDSVPFLLRNTMLYILNKEFINSHEKSFLTIYKNDYPSIISAYLDTYHNNKSRLEFDLPLWIGNSDFLIINPSDFEIFLDFLITSLEVGMFVEHAIPTMYNWSGYGDSIFAPNLYFPFGLKYNSFDHFCSTEDICNYFSKYDHLIAIHPVKFSKFKEA